MGRGGAMKQKIQACDCCPIGKDELDTSNPELCPRCIQLGHDTIPGWQCFHHPMMTESNIENMKAEIERLTAEMPTIILNMNAMRDESQIRTAEDPRAQPTDPQKRDMKSIHWEFARGTRSQKNTYSEMVDSDIALRGIETGDCSLKERQDRLKQQLIAEWTYLRPAQGVDDDSKTRGSALVLLISLIPCILHLENRMGLKLTQTAIEKGMASAIEGTLSYLTEVASQEERVNLFIKKVQSVVNGASMLGYDDVPGQWQVPYDTNAKKMDPICMDNTRVRKVIDSMDDLIDVCIADPALQTRWKRAVGNYREGMVLMRSRNVMTDEEIFSYQRYMDYFHQEWIFIAGRDGISNYEHFLSTGHGMEYLLHWRCLYTHSQQGWEAFNALFKSFYFRRTARGGRVGKDGKGIKSRLYPIGRWLMRRMIWMMDVPFEEMVAANEGTTGSLALAMARGEENLQQGVLEDEDEEDDLDGELGDSDDE